MSDHKADHHDALSMRGCVALGFTHCYATTAVLLGAVAFAGRFVKVSEAQSAPKPADLVGNLSAWGGEWYAAIAGVGYEYDAGRRSNVAFFPVYPCLAAALSKATGLPVRVALLIVSHACLLASYVLLAAYAAARWPDANSSPLAPREESRPAGGEVPQWSLIALGLFPTTFYLRMAYSESTLLCLALLAMYGMARGWRPSAVAAIVGLATAARPIGVALLAPLTMYAFSSSQPGCRHAPAWIRCLRAAALLALGCWGVLAYMVYQWWTFGEPLAFVKTQSSWSYNAVDSSSWKQARGMATLAPLRAVYDRASPCYWGIQEPRDSALFNIAFLNPICVVTAAAAVIYGARRGWLSRGEVALSAGLLLIPYVTQADRLCMWSQARFTTVVFPVYLVFGKALALAPAPLSAAVAALSAVLLAAYSALFVSWHWF